MPLGLINHPIAWKISNYAMIIYRQLIIITTTEKSKDISFLFGFQFLCPHFVLPEFVLHNVHTERSDFEVRNDAVELWKTWKAEKCVDDVCGKVGVLFPVFPEKSCQGTNHCLCINTKITHSREMKIFANTLLEMVSYIIIVGLASLSSQIPCIFFSKKF